MGPGCCSSCSALWVLWPSRSHGVEVSVTVCRLKEAFVHESQWRPLRFWRKTLPSFVDNYCPFEIQLLACYWVLVVTECLILGYQVTMLPELLSMNGVLSDSQSHKVAGVWNIPSSNGSGINVIRPKQALRIQISYMKKWLKRPWSPFLLHCPLYPNYMASWGVP